MLKVNIRLIEHKGQELNINEPCVSYDSFGNVDFYALLTLNRNANLFDNRKKRAQYHRGLSRSLQTPT